MKNIGVKVFRLGKEDMETLYGRGYSSHGYQRAVYMTLEDGKHTLTV